MVYALRSVTVEDTEKVRSNFGLSASPSKMLDLVRVPSAGRYSMWVVDDERGFYIFQAPTDMRSGYGSYAFFFENLTYVVRVYQWPGVYGRSVGSQQVDHGFSCFEGYSPIPPDDLMEEFQREFIEAFLLFRPDDYVIPAFSDPAIVHRIRLNNGIA
ncbi:hypothetical protein FACS189497_08670 [Betaproteobacteria bacterium]|nr:hypothetical protein FACS189497_08670 [Betaproteobacteria bacterium]